MLLAFVAGLAVGRTASDPACPDPEHLRVVSAPYSQLDGDDYAFLDTCGYSALGEIRPHT